jgi:hypothetical protein
MSAYPPDYYLKHRERIRKYQKERYILKHDEILEKTKAYKAQPHVKARINAYFKVYRKKHKQKRQEFRDWVKDQPCLDCGQKFPPECMDFDHRPGTIKKYDPGFVFLNNSRASTIQAEIMKCDLVCANCHRIRTAKRAKL